MLEEAEHALGSEKIEHELDERDSRQCWEKGNVPFLLAEKASMRKVPEVREMAETLLGSSSPEIRRWALETIGGKRSITKNDRSSK